MSTMRHDFRVPRSGTTCGLTTQLKGAGGGPTYQYDQPKHALATTLPLHDPLDLVSSTSARVFWERGSHP